MNWNSKRNLVTSISSTRFGIAVFGCVFGRILREPYQETESFGILNRQNAEWSSLSRQEASWDDNDRERLSFDSPDRQEVDWS
jgi:hypothetical protein